MPRTSGPPPIGSSAEKLASARWTVTCTASGFAHLNVSRRTSGNGPSQLSRPRPRALRCVRRRALGTRRLAIRRRPSRAQRRPRRREEGLRRPAQGAGPAARRSQLAVRAYRRRRTAGQAARAGRPNSASPIASPGRAGWRRTRCSPTTGGRHFRAGLPHRADGERDGLPNVLVEASSQGLVCISTDISGVPELLDDGDNGLVVPPDDPAAFAAALERAMRDPALRTRLGRAAEHKVRTPVRLPSQHPAARRPVRTGMAERTVSGSANPLLRPASARHRPSRPRQPGRRRARRRRI